MKIYDLFKFCVANLWKRKVRTVLTVLGVVIGTTSIVVMISLGVGLEVSQNESIASYMDLTTINVYDYSGGGMSYGKGSISVNNGNGNANGTKQSLNKEMLEYFNSLEHVVAATAIGNDYISNDDYSNFKMISGRYGFNGQIKVMDLTLLEALGYKIKDGRFPTAADEYPIIFGENAAHFFANLETSSSSNGPQYDELGNIKPAKVNPFQNRIYLSPRYNKRDPVTNEIIPYSGEIKDYKLNVVGVLQADYNKDYATSDSIFITMDFYEKLVADYNKLNGIKANKSKSYQTASVKVDDMKNVVTVQTKIKDFGFETWSADEMRKQNETMMKNIQMVLGALGAVSMLVAALGIANTMVMSIYERTREIGIMKVIGCKLNDIRMMFLTEAACIGMLGGIVGIALSYGLSSLINKAIGNSMGGTSGISQIPYWLVALGFFFSVGVGIIAGLYPAYRAVRISALAAIRQE